MTTKATKAKAAKASNSLFGLSESKQAGVAVELYGYSDTSFDPADVQVDNKRQGRTPACSTVVGITSFFLTPADVTRLRRYFAR